MRAALILVACTAAAQTSVLTWHNDNARTGRYLTEYLLTPANVKAPNFGKRFAHQVDGTVLGQPLYLSRVKISGKGMRNVVFAATAHDSVYAFDADSDEPPLWQVNFLDAGRGITSVPAEDVDCPVISPELGVVGTPVIDADSGTLYLIAETREPGPTYVFQLHALDVASGAERPGSPVEITAPGFVPRVHKQRTALLLSRGVIYSGWSSHCDRGDYHGWLMAHDAATLKRIGVFNATPNGVAGSFWNGGAGPSADAGGNIFAVSANGDFNEGIGNFGDSILKLAPDFSLVDFFTPFNQLRLEGDDLDLGSSGALLLPDEAGSAAHPRLLFTAGKEGRMYLLDRDFLGGTQIASDPSALASLPVLPTPAMGGAAYFKGAIYIAPLLQPVSAFPLANASLAASSSFQTRETQGALGSIPSISANGDANGIVWTLPATESGTFQAYDAATLARLYDSNSQPADALDGYVEFGVPTVADGKVYVGTLHSLFVFGFRSTTLPVVAGVTNAASFSRDAISPGSLIAIFGSDLALTTAIARDLPLPISLADVSVTINGVRAPLLYVSPSQINAQVPSSVLPGPAAVIVQVSGGRSEPRMISVQPAAPGIFIGQQGQAAAVNLDGSLTGADHPAPVGTFVSVFFTGQGPVSGTLDDGVAAPGNPPLSASQKVSASIGGLPSEVQFAGLAPGFAGLAQINLKVPALADGIYPVTITIGGQTSNSAIISISR